ncbi:hypothetical protein [Usitatibacter palustris]|uniref:Lipoprotein n=1 Tax=Usitatibacter palustris TaxID=2732487 RepID=A0A6M4H9E7_9PROT|nr:hypothetical protein [Usitatibacter palustris]QJR14667.1 hypothetical protein DSM104440_01477 [Usitatibacter palustris]
MLRLLLSALLPIAASCGKKEVVEGGSPLPDLSFGKVRTKTIGCPSMQGVYAWPPVAGTWAGRGPTNKVPGEDGIPVPIYGGEMQIWVRENGGEVEIRSRSINRNPNYRTTLTREWSFRIFPKNEVSCKTNMLEFAARPGTNPEEYGSKTVMRSFKLARLEDGSLAVGVKNLSTGRRGSIFTWGDTSAGSIPAPDGAYWSWSKLTELGPGDTEPAPVDASADRPRR